MEVCQLLKPKVRSVWDFFYYKMATYHTNLSKSFNLWEITWLLKCTDDSTKNKKLKKKNHEIMKISTYCFASSTKHYWKLPFCKCKEGRYQVKWYLLALKMACRYLDDTFLLYKIDAFFKKMYKLSKCLFLLILHRSNIWYLSTQVFLYISLMYMLVHMF